MRVCIKVGGALVEDRAGRARLAGMLQRARAQGLHCVLVHGGGRQIREVCERLGLAEKRFEGLRITDAETARAVTWVLAGEVNKAIVAALLEAGLRALGLCGADLGIYRPQRKHAPKGSGVDLGYVGTLEPEDIAPAGLEALITAGILPVLATIGPEQGANADGPFLNVNADEAAGPIAAALRCNELIFLSDIPGVLDRHGELLAHLDRRGAERLIDEGTIHGGMIPKIRAALDAADAGVQRVRIVSGGGAEALQDALDGHGTLIQSAATQGSEIQA